MTIKDQMIKEKIKTKYDLQSERFLEKTGTKIEKLYTEHRRHFEDEKQYRACFSITITRNDKSINFDFGNSIVDSWDLYDNFKRLGRQHKYWTALKVKEAIQTGQELNEEYNIKLKKRKKAPSDYSILACLEKYDIGTFDNFCSEFGYDADSRKAEKTYFAAQKQYSDLTRLFNNEEIEELAEIQ